MGLYESLEKIVAKENIYVDEPMSKHITFRVGGPADVLIRVNTLEELRYVVNKCKEKNINLTVIGNGSNLLVKDRRN